MDDTQQGMSQPEPSKPRPKYPVREDQVDAIIEKAAYHRHEFCRSVIYFPPYTHDEIRHSIGTPFQRTFSDMGAGSLDRLPLELMYNVFLQLDMHSLFRFRQANLRARQLLDSLSQYQIVVSHGLNLFRALLRTGLAVYTRLSVFFDTLCEISCVYCGRFAGFVSILVWRRCCFQCLHSRPEVKVQTLASAYSQLRMNRHHLRYLVTMRTLPGAYAMMHARENAIMVLVATPDAQRVTGRQPPTRERSHYDAMEERDAKLSFMASCALPHYDRATKKVQYGLSCAGCDREWAGSNDSSLAQWTLRAQDRVYDKRSFISHFKRCVKAQRLWESGEERKGRRRDLSPIFRERMLSPGSEARRITGRSVY
ncbi:hypothetical protein F5B18DRAFT_623895 [Nemania serpens]|nr:hypothetical protein F5B18DRAFT_623895 [Nemania serpens]